MGRKVAEAAAPEPDDVPAGDVAGTGPADGVEREEWVRDRAYFLWLQGDGTTPEENWFRAEAEVLSVSHALEP